MGVVEREDGPPLTRMAAEVDRPGLGDVVDLPASPPQPEAEVNVLRIEEVSLVEAADLLDGLPPQHHAGTAYPVHHGGAPVVEVEHEIPLEKRMGGEERLEEGVP